jgi:hypothetical protein
MKECLDEYENRLEELMKVRQQLSVGRRELQEISEEIQR